MAEAPVPTAPSPRVRDREVSVQLAWAATDGVIRAGVVVVLDLISLRMLDHCLTSRRGPLAETSHTTRRPPDVEGRE